MDYSREIIEVSAEAAAHQQRARELIAEAARRMEFAARQGGERGHRFSITRAVRCLTRDGGAGLYDGIEAEIGQELARQAGRHHDPNKPFLPWSVLMGRALNTGTGTTGAFLLGTAVPTVADALAPWSVTLSAGLTTFDGLRSDLTIPREGTAPQAQWAGETGTATSTDPVFGAANMSPTKAIAYVELSSQLLKQGPVADAFLARTLRRSLGRLIDSAVIAGNGTNQPVGIVNTSDVQVTTGTSLTYANLLNEQEQLALGGVQDINHKWVGHPTVRETLAARTYGTNISRYLWDEDKILGRPAYATPDVGTGRIVHGDWSQVALGVWGGGFALEHNPFANFRAEIHGFRAVVYCDVAVLQPSAIRVLTGIT